MSFIRDKIEKHIRQYDIAKTGKWDKPEPPPSNTFSLSEMYIIGDSIARDIEGYLSDCVLLPTIMSKRGGA